MYIFAIVISFCVNLVILFQQNDYRLEHHHSEIVYYNKTFLNYVRLYNVKPNRTFRAYSVFFKILRRLDGDHIKLNLQLDAILNNIPKLRIIQYDLKVCSCLEGDSHIIREIFKSSNVTKCPIKKGFYGIQNYNVDEKRLPPNIPEGKYRLAITMWEKNSIIAKGYLFGEVIYNPKK